nr:MAG TPA: hypothetical protein [Caudoviricetes sp.]
MQKLFTARRLGCWSHPGRHFCFTVATLAGVKVRAAIRACPELHQDISSIS